MVCTLLNDESCVTLGRKEGGGDLLSRKERALKEIDSDRATCMNAL